MSFEESFFGPGNLLRWEAIQSRTLSADTLRRLDPFVAGLREGADLLFLPRARQGDQTVWYALCASERELRVVRDELRAFLGPSYSTTVGFGALSAEDPVEQAVMERFGTNAIRFRLPNPVLADVARERLLLLLRIRLERPHNTGRRVRATGRMLRDFEYALQTHDDATAIATVDEIRNAGRLDAANLLFLDVRRRVFAGQYSQVVMHPQLGSLLSMRRPRRVTEALILAIYEVELRGFESKNDPEGAHAHFANQVRPRFSALFDSRVGMNGAALDASFMLLAASSTPPGRDLAAAVVANAIASGRPTDYLLRIAALIAPELTSNVPSNALADAGDAFTAGDIDRALARAREAPASGERAVLLLHCAFVIGALAPAEDALAALDALPDDSRQHVLQNIRLANIVTQLRSLEAPLRGADNGVASTGEVTNRVPDSWPMWLVALQGPSRWAAAVSVAERGAREWSFDALVDDSEAVVSVADLLMGQRAPWAETSLRDALPYMVEFTLSRGADARLRSVYDGLFLLMALDDQQSLAQVRNFLRVAEALLTVGIGRDSYRELLDQLATALERTSTPGAIEVALDALEVVLWSACPANDARQAFAGSVGALCNRWYRKVDASQRLLLSSLSVDVGVPFHLSTLEVGADEPGSSAWNRLHGKSIALYSLQESALRRAAAMLHELVPGVIVACFHDKVGGSPSLRTAAANADIFVIATSVAKHAATGFIEMNRRDKPTLYARGGGSASLLAALHEHSG